MNDRSGGIYGREVPLSASYLATLASPEPDPETQLIAAQEGLGEGPEPLSQSPRQAKRLQLILTRFLSVEESHLLQAYYGLGQSQAALAEHLGIFENSLQYRLARALERVRWAMQLETWNRSRRAMIKALGGVLGNDTPFAIALWVNRWNQSRTADWIGSTQSRVRVRTLRLYDVLKGAADDRRVRPYARDLGRVIEGRAWCVGAPQHQEGRAIKLASQTTGVQLALQFRRKAA